MSSHNCFCQEARESKPENLIKGLLVVVCCVVTFVILVVGAAYLYRPSPVMGDIIKERMEKLAEVNKRQEELVTRYEWVDKEKGVVRIPVERAMQVIVEEYNKGGAR